MCYVLLKDLNLFEVCSCRFFFVLFWPYYILLDNIDIAVVDFFRYDIDIHNVFFFVVFFFKTI